MKVGKWALPEFRVLGPKDSVGQMLLVLAEYVSERRFHTG